MRNWLSLGMLVGLAVTGCSPMRLVTANRVCGVVNTDSRVVMEMGVTPDGGSILATPLGKSCANSPRIALLDVDGLLLNQDFTGPMSMGENPVALFREKLDAIAEDPLVRAVVLRINTPGGSVTATDILWHDLRTFKSRTRLPIVACLMDVAAGGGYYLATAADQILAHPTSVTGGIGVILNLYNLQDLMGQFNIRPQEIKSGRLIDMGSVTRNLPEEAKRLLEGMAQEYHERFRQIVLEARPNIDREREAVFDGRVFTAKTALEMGLVDRLGYIDDALALARQLGQCPDAGVALYRRANDPARSPYAMTPNTPLQATLLPLSIPGMDRTKLPTFLYLWQPEATMPRLGGR